MDSSGERVVLVFIQLDRHTNNIRVSTKTGRQESTYITLFLTRHKYAINDENNDELHTWTPWLTHSVYLLLMTSQLMADEVTSASPDASIDAPPQKVISNSLNIDWFIFILVISDKVQYNIIASNA